MSDEDAGSRAHRELVRTAVGAHGGRSIAERVTSALGGWSLLLNGDGELIAAIPESARTHLARIRAELSRFSGTTQIATMAINLPNESVSIRPVVITGRVRGHLAIGRGSPLTGMELSLVDTATYLLAEDLHHTDQLRQAARNSRHAVLALLLGGHVATARSTGDILGVAVPDGPVRVAVLGTQQLHAADLLEIAEEDQALRRIDTVTARLRSGHVGIVLSAAEGDLRTLETVLRQVPFGRGAVSESVALADLPAVWRSVRGVFRAAPDEPGRLFLAKDVYEAGLLRHLSGADARTWARATLQSVRALNQASKVDFADTLRVFLGNNGQADASANALGIHRHTLRYRMTRISDALGRDLDDPTVRAELWFALRLENDDD